jgi:glutaconate CoA-transferase subunit A
LARATPDIVYDQMVAAGCARKLVFSWAGNPGVGMLHAVRRAIESRSIEISEFTHFSMLAMLEAGAMRLPFFPLPDGTGGELAAVNPSFRTTFCPYTGQRLATVPSLRPDVAFIHAQRADKSGNVQLWGIVGEQQVAALASAAVVATVEEIVSEDVIRSDPNRTLVPAQVVDALVCEPWAAHPSYVQSYYDRDDDFYRDWADLSCDNERVQGYLQAWVHDLPDRSHYARALGRRLTALSPTSAGAA